MTRVKRSSVHISGRYLFYLNWLWVYSDVFQRATPVKDLQSFHSSGESAVMEGMAATKSAARKDSVSFNAVIQSCLSPLIAIPRTGWVVPASPVLEKSFYPQHFFTARDGLYKRDIVFDHTLKWVQVQLDVYKQRNKIITEAVQSLSFKISRTW